MSPASSHMNLCIDIGNTRAKIAVFQDGKIIYYEERKNLGVRALGKILREFPIEASIISSTRHQDEKVCAWLEERTKFEWLDHKTPVPIVNLYQTPKTLGKDRLAGVVGVQAEFPDKNCLLIDAGTCITVDFLDESGNYHGGSISPGLHLRSRALHNFTKKLPLIQPEAGTPVEGKTTREAILSGIMHGTTLELEGFIRHYKKQFGSLKVIVTGGDTTFFEKHIKTAIFARPKIVLFGLNQILDFKSLSTR